MKLSYGILVCNELEEIRHLVSKIDEFLDEEDEIIVVADSDSVTDEVADFLIAQEQSGLLKFHLNSLNKDFAQQKNFLMDKCNGDYIINIDADEIPNDVFFLNIKDILLENKESQIIAVPRVNIVNGITEDYIKQMRWTVNSQGWVNYPDYQLRVIKNDSNLKWEGKVHEKVVGGAIQLLPAIEDLSFYHIKTFERQRKQNEFYETI